MSPPVMLSSPAVIRSKVDLPHPEGPDEHDKLAIRNIDIDAVKDLNIPIRFSGL